MWTVTTILKLLLHISSTMLSPVCSQASDTHLSLYLDFIPELLSQGIKLLPWCFYLSVPCSSDLMVKYKSALVFITSTPLGALVPLEQSWLPYRARREVGTGQPLEHSVGTHTTFELFCLITSIQPAPAIAVKLHMALYHQGWTCAFVYTGTSVSCLRMDIWTDSDPKSLSTTNMLCFWALDQQIQAEFTAQNRLSEMPQNPQAQAHLVLLEPGIPNISPKYLWICS